MPLAEREIAFVRGALPEHSRFSPNYPKCWPLPVLLSTSSWLVTEKSTVHNRRVLQSLARSKARKEKPVQLAASQQRHSRGTEHSLVAPIAFVMSGLA